MTLKKCPSCGHQHDSADIVCPYCKHSYSEKKYICNNCGAYLQPADKVCYVCGQVVEELTAVTAEPPVVEEKAQPVYEQTVEDIAKRVSQGDTTYKDINETVEKEEKEETEKPLEKPKKSKTKKVAVACTVIVVIVALLAAGVCLCHYKGWINFNQDQPEDTNITVYFEKPMSNQNLMTADGTVYNWTGDVDVNYTCDGKDYKNACKMTDEYDGIWFIELPSDAQNVYFSETTLEVVRTAVISQPEDDYIYYVTDILFNSDVQLPVDGCHFNDFNGLGVNHYTVEPEPATETPTVAETVAETENTADVAETEPATEEAPVTEVYNISIPEQWNEDLAVIQNGNCTNYYENYNYSNYQCGNLLSVYVVDGSDTSYSEMNVQKVVTTSDGTKKIVVVTPTDIQFNDSDDTAIEKYTSMSQYTTQVVDSITAN